MLTYTSTFTWLAMSVLVCRVSGGRLRRRQTALANVGANQGCAYLQEENNGTHYTVLVDVGTPGQSFSVVADTGSNSLIVPSCICQEKGECQKSDRCFRGTNISSTFVFDPVKQGSAELLVTFGSGRIGAVVARDVADVGGLRVNMSDGILLMVDNALRLPGKFEGILGLGLREKNKPLVLTEVASVPADRAKVIDELKKILGGGGGGGGGSTSPRPGMPGGSRKNEPVMNISAPESFLEQAGVDRFSMCFNSDGTGGVLQMGIPALENELTNVGHDHWALDFRGISVGKGSKPSDVRFCTASNKSKDMETACGIIPDSGTTAIMGPKASILMLMEDVCDNWERCRNNHTKMVLAAEAAKKAAAEIYTFDPFGYKPLDKAALFQVLLADCSSWLDDGSLEELPPLLFHVAGKNGEKQSLEIPSSAYLFEADVDESAGTFLASDVPGLTHSNRTGGKRRACTASFGAMEYPTKLNGDVWILGVPLFSQYKVSYDLKAKHSGTMSFTQLDGAGCGSCATSADKKEALIASRTDRAQAAKAGRRHLRRVSGPSRTPEIDVTRPL